MDGLEWTDELKLELIRLRSELTPQSLEILNRGIGIGSFKKVTKSEQTRTGHSQQAQKPRHIPYEVPLKKNPSTNYQTQTLSKVGFDSSFRWRTHLLVFFYDLVFTVATILMGSLSLGLALDYKGFAAKEWSSWLPFALVKSSSLSIGIVVILSLYLLYRVTFKLIIGRTVGETLVKKGIF